MNAFDVDDPRPLIAGVLGDPIKHSRSPVLYEYWFGQYGIAGRYVPLWVRADDFAAVLRALPKAGFRGVNVTLPHKETALALADRASEAAQTIGAANTLVFTQAGEIVADNTDAFGFYENLRAGCAPWQADAGPAVVIGAGGAARAVIYVLRQHGCPLIRLINRTQARAETLAAHFGAGVAVVPWANRASALEGAATIVNTTSLGMTGQPPLDLALDAAPARALISDIVYTPLETPFLRAARARGLDTVDGLGMLLHQARPGFSAFFGTDPTVSGALRRAVLGASV